MAQMAQNPSSADDEGIQLTYSTLPPSKRSHTPLAALSHDEEPESGPVQAAWGAWPQPYRRMLHATFLGAVLALGMVLGTVLSGHAATLRSSSLPSRPSLLTLPTTPATDLGGVPVTAATRDARFVIVTLGIQCLHDACDGSRYVSAGQPIYALQGGWSCTTLSAAEVVGHHEQYVYCRLAQPNVFAATFDGAPFDCVGSQLGCHFVVQVETTNGR